MSNTTEHVIDAQRDLLQVINSNWKQRLASSAASFVCTLHFWHGSCHDQAVIQQVLTLQHFVTGQPQAHADAWLVCVVTAGLPPLWL